MLTGVRAVVFDVGETLVDESLSRRAFARHVGVPVERVDAELERAIAAGRDHRAAFEAAAGRTLRPGEFSYIPTERDLYADAVPALRALVGAGYAVGIVGNQPQSIEGFLESLGMRLALVGSSQRWGVLKPDPAFFERVITELAMEPAQIVYVGDRVDNDIVPAGSAGLRSALVVRGPWGRRHVGWDRARLADVIVDDLAGLTAALGVALS